MKSIACNSDPAHNKLGLYYTPMMSTATVFYTNMVLPMYLSLTWRLLILTHSSVQSYTLLCAYYLDVIDGHIISPTVWYIFRCGSMNRIFGLYHPLTTCLSIQYGYNRIVTEACPPRKSFTVSILLYLTELIFIHGYVPMCLVIIHLLVCILHVLNFML